MYDDLARAQQPSILERLVLNTVIPSVLLTLALHSQSVETRPQNCDDCGGVPLLLACECPECCVTLGPVPDAFPVLVRMPRPVYPAVMRRDGIEGRVVLRALVNPRGRVDSTSILVVQTTDGSFVPSAFQALARAVFRPARFGGHAGAAWITIDIDFTLRRE
jgi:TonB family protein